MRWTIFFLLIITLSSCSTKKNILYIQNANSISEINFKYFDYRLKIDDILRIKISSNNPESLVTYNSINVSKSFNNREMMMFEGYKVNSNGKIEIESIGSFDVVGLTINDVKSKIENRIIKTGFLTDSNVDVKLLNAQFTIIGEVNSPGRYFFDQNNLNILEAIGMAGDLTINGERSDIKVVRETNKKHTVFSIDITNIDFLKSDKYQIVSGDIIIINPNNNRIKNAGIIGNSGTLLSLLSFILSSIIVISN